MVGERQIKNLQLNQSHMNDGICSAGVVKHRSIAGVVKLDFYSVYDYKVDCCDV